MEAPAVNPTQAALISIIYVIKFYQFLTCSQSILSHFIDLSKIVVKKLLQSIQISLILISNRAGIHTCVLPANSTRLYPLLNSSLGNKYLIEKGIRRQHHVGGTAVAIRRSDS